jgi:hypothetical protein
MTLYTFLHKLQIVLAQTANMALQKKKKKPNFSCHFHENKLESLVATKEHAIPICK